ncbi:RNA polymerase factor sigma-54 [Shumkonia mesophila]|uniref:RNA polymerase factor sigma-54 n=1 Tax=Shumkonia mesophila TaxID=2838854 RepID=UPI002934C78D|nr:RNA polymerase factor sigma-54 [Shumkonia mesophila]
MALTPRLELRQSQALVMTPQLQQAIKLLQLSNMELSAFVEEELAKNPLLEREEGEATGGADGAGDAETSPDGGQDGSAPAGEDGGGDGLEGIDFTETRSAATTEDLDVDYDNVWNNDSAGDAGDGGLADTAFATWGGGAGGSFEPTSGDLEQTLSEEKTLRDHLIGQMNMEFHDPAERVIGLQLIDRLDDAGYLAESVESVAAILGCAPARVEATLGRLQRLDPSGIFARDLAECLALQLRERDRLDPAMQALIANLELLAKRDLAGLMRVCGVDREDLLDMVAELRALNPKPALSFDSAVAPPITPDILMRPQPNGGWSVELNAETLPRLLVNNRYHAVVSKAVRTKEDRHYIDDCFQSANWLVKSLHQRATTILKVAAEIVRQQDGFFAHGVQFLRPLVLRDIAEAIEMHESTVSRVTSNKFIASPRGIYELKYFFTASIASSSGGQAHSAESVRCRIRELIEAEKPAAVLSDDTLVEMLSREGVEVARRTVAKYRESLGIASSVQRRRNKTSGL